MTIDEMAAVSEDDGDTRSSVLVKMSAGDTGPPLFFFPGSAGRLWELKTLVGHIRNTGPIYGIKPKGGYPGETPHDRIEEMAEYAFNEIKLAAQGGPYLLAGYSAGGLVAFETACRLVSSGDTVTLLALLDTYPNELAWPIGCQLQVIAKRFAHRLNELRVIPRNEIKSFFRARVRGVIGYLWRLGLGLRSWERSETLPPDLRVHFAMLSAVARYRPGYYGSKVTLFQPEEIDMQPRDPRRVWQKFTRELELYVVPGSHMSMIYEVEILAARLSTCLKTAIEDPGPSEDDSRCNGDAMSRWRHSRRAAASTSGR